VARRREHWFLSAVTNPDIARFTYAAARILRDFGVAGTLGRVLPGKTGELLRMLAATSPAFEPDSVPGPDDSSIDDYRPAEDEHEERYVLLTGCVMDGLFAHVHAATRRTLARAGYREIQAPEQTCCGALHAHAGLLAQARELARRNIEAFERTEPDWIITDSAGCGAGLKDYPAWFADEPEWRERAAALAERARDVTEVLAAALTSGAPDAGLSSSIGLEGRVGYDAPCHLHHGQGVTEEPLEVLRAVPGLEVEALPSSDRCCGGAGMYNLAQPDLAALVRAPKVGEVRRGSFDWIATGNPGCIMYLGAGLLRSGDRTPVVHPVELVDRAWS
jgi:glycolate oxidase iron-sulfur subunit